MNQERAFEAAHKMLDIFYKLHDCMKKIMIAIVLLLLLALISVYLFLPSQFNLSYSGSMNATTKNVTSTLHQPPTWNRWWPEQGVKMDKDSFFLHGDWGYKLLEPLADGAEILLRKSGRSYRTRIILLPNDDTDSSGDALSLQWQADFHSSLNPFKRIQEYFDVESMMKNWIGVVNSLGSFVSEPKNIYGFHIERTTYTDTVLLATKFTTQKYPGPEEIYKTISQLRKIIAANGGKEINYPMLNVRTDDSLSYQVMVAVCLDRTIHATQTAFISRMMAMKDRFLSTEVRGGPGTIKNAHEAIYRYMEDHFLTAPAIPFEILVTDRSMEKDTAKWKTVIYHPSM